MVHLPEWLRPSARLARQKVLAPRTAFFSRAPPSDLSPSTSASSFNNRQLEHLYSAGDSEAGPEGANPLLKPSDILCHAHDALSAHNSRFFLCAMMVFLRL
ncbi:hypothetical protein HBI56_154060 [Parastagonospora nodorum]|nr:hypothetical protein HBH51_149020 [Parastagonospora nodorum]KAH3998792.1 hypothetical protein HBI10_126050 [Parastagonospora nodorum]KAH4088839.1 hypothetical protein HBH48_119610 [Parastagonospora nodorum]KAH4104288.1 hypothetical protein HBH46_100230 [Parastagonospora nodorum]KAH4121983.1 hypothetical protein HBH47_095020 [Parastagonospora nodorum]